MIFRQGVWISIRDFDQESICGGISYCDLAISSKTLNYVLSISPEVGVIGAGVINKYEYVDNINYHLIPKLLLFDHAKSHEAHLGRCA